MYMRGFFAVRGRVPLGSPKPRMYIRGSPNGIA